jgi:hypothetical protein
MAIWLGSRIATGMSSGILPLRKRLYHLVRYFIISHKENKRLTSLTLDHESSNAVYSRVTLLFRKSTYTLVSLILKITLSSRMNNRQRSSIRSGMTRTLMENIDIPLSSSSLSYKTTSSKNTMGSGRLSNSIGITSVSALKGSPVTVPL